MRKLFLFFFLLISFKSFEQCTASATVNENETVCGECITLKAIGNTGATVFSDNFNTSAPTGWAYISPSDFTNPCSFNGVDGTIHMWMGNGSGSSRLAETNSFDLTSGGTVCFDMLYANQGSASPCEGPDGIDEGVYLEYSTDGGINWITIQYHNPIGGYDSKLTNWNKYCYAIPVGAQTANTKIRWFQDKFTGPGFDCWGIDNINVTLNDPLTSISWLHDGYNYGTGNTGGMNPTPVCLKNDSLFIVMVTNGLVTCYDTVDVKVKTPTINLNLTPQNTFFCKNQCVPINIDALVVIDTAKEQKYEIIESDSIDETGGSVSSSISIGINVKGVNTSYLNANSIKKVCINGLSVYNNKTFPAPSTLDISDVKIELISPDSSSVILVNKDTTTGGGGAGYNNGYLNTCFVTGGANIASGSFPYTGDWSPYESFDSLIGSMSNGIWILKISETNAFLNLKGRIEGFSITFKDDSVFYPALISWNHTTWVSDSSSLNPNICPQIDTSYILTVNDSVSCVSIKDTITFLALPFTNAGRDTSLISCDTNLVNLANYLESSVQAGGSWINPSNNPVTMPVSPVSSTNGQYTYILSNPSGCFDSATITYAASLFTAVPYYYTYQDVSTNDLYLVDSSYGDTSAISYYWDFGDGNSSLLKYPTHTYLTHGKYNLCLSITDSIGCSATYCDTLEVDSSGNLIRSSFTINIVPYQDNTVNINDIKQNDIVLYPNPNSGLFVLKFKEIKKISSYKIFDVYGKLVLECDFIDQKKQINATNLNNGVYYLTCFHNGTARGNVKFIISR